MQTQRAVTVSAIDTIILDDNQFDRVRLKRFLRDLAMPVVIREADCLRAFKNIVNKQYFDLAFVDYDLPDGTGSDALKYLIETRPTPTIMITGNTSPYIQDTARRYGCLEQMNKSRLSSSSLSLASKTKNFRFP